MKQYTTSLSLLIIALLMGLTLQAQTPCDPDGDGNPDVSPNAGAGEGTDNASGDLAWELLLNTTCPGQELNLGVKDYDPSDNCNNSSNLIPEAGQRFLKIAIIDSGVRPTEPGFFNQQKLTSHVVNSAGVVTYAVAHPHPHGTYSAGVISGLLTRYTGGGGGHNIVTRFELLDYQVLNNELRTSLTAVVAAINHAVDSKADLIALSIGFLPRVCDNIDWENPNSPLYAAIEHARQKGVVVITSAGNDGNDLAEEPQYPAAYTELKNLVSVGALACEAEIPATFSNYSEQVVDVFTTGAYVQVFYNGCFHTIDGTSFATSIVAGKAAIHFTKYSKMDEVLCLLRSQTKPFQAGRYSIYGIVDVLPGREDAACGSGVNPGEGGKALSKDGALKIMTSPNPFHDQLRVQLEELNGPASISLLNGLGQRVLTQRVSQSDLVLDLSHLSTGVYWLVVRDASGSQTRTVVKK